MFIIQMDFRKCIPYHVYRPVDDIEELQLLQKLYIIIQSAGSLTVHKGTILIELYD